REDGSRNIGLPARRPEGVAALPDGRFVVGTWDGQIYMLSESLPALFGRGSGIVAGIRPDPATGTLLACFTDEEGGRAVVQRHRIADGAVVAMYPLPASRAFCNDIALTGDGFAVTESNGGRVYQLARGRLVPLPIEPLFYPNGIAADPASGRLYIAHGSGILVFDARAGRSAPLEVDGTLLGGIDGLAWHDGGLIAVQNVAVPARVLRIAPDSGGPAAVRLLLSGSALLQGATTVAARGGAAFILSHTGIPTGAPPNDQILIRVPLQGP
ncbi:MAG TPA: hypothetical protein VJS15_05345, partial [Allosphingosinicella sp.]|nr:hypothetical protein [Allosphingosinicella sp.]